MKTLTKRQILLLHQQLIDATGGAAWVWAGQESSFCGWQQTNRSACHAGAFGAEWH